MEVRLEEPGERSASESSRLVLVTGGCRSGKSAFALRYVEENATERIFLATCPVIDAEMSRRIDRHQKERYGRNWQTHEEETEIARALGGFPNGAGVLLDCLTLWVNNLMYRAEQQGAKWPEEDAVETAAAAFIAAARARDGLTVAVTNEVGLGVVPDNQAARRFRDLVGRVNQTIAGRADKVYLLVSGISIRVK